MMTKDGLIFEANSLKQGRLQALTRQQLQAQATQNRERRWVEPVSIPNRERNDLDSGVGGTLTNDTTLVLYGIHSLGAVSRRSLEEGPDTARRCSGDDEGSPP